MWPGSLASSLYLRICAFLVLYILEASLEAGDCFKCSVRTWVEKGPVDNTQSPSTGRGGVGCWGRTQVPQTWLESSLKEDEGPEGLAGGRSLISSAGDETWSDSEASVTFSKWHSFSFDVETATCPGWGSSACSQVLKVLLSRADARVLPIGEQANPCERLAGCFPARESAQEQEDTWKSVFSALESANSWPSGEMQSLNSGPKA